MRHQFGGIMGEMVCAQALGIGVAALSLFGGASIWVAVVAGTCVGATLALQVRGRSVLRWAATAALFARDSGYELGTITDFRGPGGRPTGLYWDGDRVVAVLELSAAPGGISYATKESNEPAHTVPLAVFASLLTQHDIMLAGIDIISHGRRSQGPSIAAREYERLLGRLQAPTSQTVWLAVALDVVANAEAVRRRGGGTRGAARAVTIAATRIVRELERQGCPARILTGTHIKDAVLTISGGTDPRTLTQHWRYAVVGSAVNTGAVSKRCDTALLAATWSVPAETTSVAIRLRPGSALHSVAVGASWRLSGATAPHAPPGSAAVHGHHRDALLAHLPLAAPRSDRVVPLRECTVDDWQLPTVGCGQLIGSDPQGRAVLARLTGTGVANVYLAGGMLLAQQVVFRALATGARILIRTDRPHAWERLTAAVTDSSCLHIDSPATLSDAGYTAVVSDGVRSDPRPDATMIHLSADRATWPSEPPDISIEQLDGAPNTVVLRAGAKKVEVTLISTASETSILDRELSRQLVAAAS
ncbi:type VII secretion protein EccE [Skermania sp. ID1734]|uniref:type VII secretion protein EccE n=1 Tax=Skermania sp. ID1734 TaxID=2597516 RepID=UPI00163D4532|nr:type VII secretion protein EccE [Skermania sp. ID1734]